MRGFRAGAVATTCALLFAACSGSGTHRPTPTPTPRPTVRPDVVLVVRYDIGIPDLSERWPASAVAALTGAVACTGWDLNPLSRGPGTAFELHLRVAATRADSAAALVRSDVARATLTTADLRTYSIRPTQDDSLGSSLPITC
jgi:hypothetical protein